MPKKPKEIKPISDEELQKVKDCLPKGLWEKLPTERKLTKDEADLLADEFDIPTSKIPAIACQDRRVGRSVEGYLIKGARFIGKPVGYQTPQTKLAKALEESDDIGVLLQATIKDYLQDIDNHTGAAQQGMRIQGFEKIIDRIEKLAGIERQDSIYDVFDDPFSEGYIDPKNQNNNNIQDIDSEDVTLQKNN